MRSRIEDPVSLVLWALPTDGIACHLCRTMGRSAVRLVVIWIVAAIALEVSAALIPGVDISNWAAALAAAALLGLLNALVWPFLVRVALPITVLTIGLGALVLNCVIVVLAATILPGFTVASIWSALGLCLTLTLVNMVVTSALAIDDDDFYYRNVVRRMAKRRGAVSSTDAGVIFVQLDGLAHEVLVRAIRNGDTPTLARWVRTGTHRAMRWETDWSSQTGGSQSGLLQGSNFDMPAFRWWEKETNRALVSNHPRDAAEIERRHSDGRGLLAQGGASRGNVFSGDAPRSSLTMSTVLTRHREGRIGQAYYAYFANPYNLIRTILLAIREIGRERYDAARQRHRDVSPRIERDFSYALLRAWTCVVQRDLQVEAVIGDVYEGRPVVFTDILGYDEVAHHSGVERADSLRVLRDIDRQLARLEKASRDAPRPYQIVVLSDHGQSQGPTFRQRYGASLEDLVRQSSAAADIDNSSEGDESRGYLAGSLAEASAGKGFLARLLKRLVPATPDGTGVAPELVVMASGNLGLIYFGQRPGRLTLEEIQEAYPRLIPTLRSHPGIGFLMVHSGRDGTVVLGKEGTRYLNDDRVAGIDPLGLFGPNAAAHLRRTDTFPHAGDIMVNGACASDTSEVFAFEELVGSHGGLGGAQSFPFLLVPSSWPQPSEPLVGAEAVHRYFRLMIGDPTAAGISPRAQETPLARLEAERT